MSRLAHMTNDAGEELVPVVIAKSRPFAAACLAEWTKRDGIDRKDWINRAAINVPADIVEAARRNLRKRV